MYLALTWILQHNCSLFLFYWNLMDKSKKINVTLKIKQLNFMKMLIFFSMRLHCKLNVTSYYKTIFMSWKQNSKNRKQRFYVKDSHYFPRNIFKDQTNTLKTISTKKLIKRTIYIELNYIVFVWIHSICFKVNMTKKVQNQLWELKLKRIWRRNKSQKLLFYCLLTIFK